MREILESTLDIVEILEFITTSSEKTDSWMEVLNGNSSLIYQRIKNRKTGSIIRFIDLIPVSLALQKKLEKFSGVIHLNQTQTISLNLSSNFTIIVPPESSLMISDGNSSTVLVSRNRNEWIILKIRTTTQFLQLTNKTFNSILLLLFI